MTLILFRTIIFKNWKWIPWFRNCEKCYVSAAEFCALKNQNFYEMIIDSKITWFSMWKFKKISNMGIPFSDPLPQTVKPRPPLSLVPHFFFKGGNPISHCPAIFSSMVATLVWSSVVMILAILIELSIRWYVVSDSYWTILAEQMNIGMKKKHWTNTKT